MKYIYSILFVFIIYQNAYSQDKVLEIGEELKYRVYFGFIKLGEVKFKLTSFYKEGKKEYYNASAQIKSFEGIPFVDVNFVFESVMEVTGSDEEENREVFSNKFYSTEFKDKSITRIEYDFNYEDSIIQVSKETDGNIENFEKVPIEDNTHFQDGLSIFYNARLHSFSNKNYNIPVYINEKASSVKYSFNINEDVVSVDADKIDYDVSVVKIAGVADFIGVFGLTGEFVSWLSNDEARVPVKAQFNVKIGSISLELYSYKKKSWNPPPFEK